MTEEGSAVAVGAATHYQGVDPTRLPRYRFTQTGVGCKAHDDPACLCDVVITAPVADDAFTVSFSGLAKQAMGATRVSEGNFYEWASLVLGMHDAERNLPPDESATKPTAHKGTVTAWSLLPADVRERMVDGYYNKVAWSEAATWLPPMSKQDRTSIYKYYNQRLYAKNTQQRKRNPK